MEILIKTIHYIQNLNKKQLEQHIIAVLAGIALLAGIFTYFIYIESNSLLKEFKKVEDLSKKSVQILADNARLQRDAQYIQDLFDQSKDFMIKSYFETFCKEEQLTPEPGWTTRTEEPNDRYEETSLTAIFKGQTMEKLVKILSILEKKEIIYFKNITIKNESSKKISFELTLATKLIKLGLDQKSL